MRDTENLFTSTIMFNLIIWFFVFPRLLYNIILIIVIILLIVSYKVFKVLRPNHRTIIKRGKMYMTMSLKKTCKRNSTTSSGSLQNVAHLSLAIFLVVWSTARVECDIQVSFKRTNNSQEYMNRPRSRALQSLAN